LSCLIFTFEEYKQWSNPM